MRGAEWSGDVNELPMMGMSRVVCYGQRMRIEEELYRECRRLL